jgi:hypothetical protein
MLIVRISIAAREQQQVNWAYGLQTVVYPLSRVPNFWQEPYYRLLPCKENGHYSIPLTLGKRNGPNISMVCPSESF